MSCFPCFGKKKEEGAEQGGVEPGPASNMTPPEPVQAPAWYAPAAASTTPPSQANDAKRPGGGEQASLPRFVDSERDRNVCN